MKLERLCEWLFANETTSTVIEVLSEEWPELVGALMGTVLGVLLARLF